MVYGGVYSNQSKYLWLLANGGPRALKICGVNMKCVHGKFGHLCPFCRGEGSLQAEASSMEKREITIPVSVGETSVIQGKAIRHPLLGVAIISIAILFGCIVATNRGSGHRAVAAESIKPPSVQEMEKVMALSAERQEDFPALIAPVSSEERKSDFAERAKDLRPVDLATDPATRNRVCWGAVYGDVDAVRFSLPVDHQLEPGNHIKLLLRKDEDSTTVSVEVTIDKIAQGNNRLLGKRSPQGAVVTFLPPNVLSSYRRWQVMRVNLL